MKELVRERLASMGDLEQRKLLKGIVSELFLNLVEHQETMLDQLERRVFDELEDSGDGHDVYVTACARADVDPIHDYLYPMMPGDEQEQTYDLTAIVSALQRREPVKLLKVFMACDYLRLKELYASGRTFRGELVTTSGRSAITARLEPCGDYIAEIEKLYRVFLRNGLTWKTVFHPYANKFANVVLVGCDRVPEANEEILELTIDCEEYEPYKQLDVVPLWNIERIVIKNSGFPVPARDHVHYEHVLSLRKLGEENGYLVDADEGDVRYVKRSADELTIVTPREKSGLWEVLKLAKPKPQRIGDMAFDMYSNRRTNDFIGRYARRQPHVVRAKGELIRIARSFVDAVAIELIDTSIEERQAAASQTYGMNPFIDDQVRTVTDKKVMRLTFRQSQPSDQARLMQPEISPFIRYDLMSFVVSEIQMYFPEYECEGVWS
ncbi:normocyte-binding protein [Paenibacillus sp. MMS18-CY102]|uniref:normocyte-binding protein n=1 Tax=Paenibacillus sp. MMS18-CY102 TaxID=2682849 RepID=UPI0013652B93|nr:normocyte-binding protein [Paenibacillus sp. MMS18-CY102]MWC31335.1 normocyte-binding protein [Paenibacillus sp. MMS18-CY102]